MADKRLARRLATYIAGGALTTALLVLATSATVGLVVTGAAQGYDSGGTQGAGVLGAGTVNPNTGAGMLLETALFMIVAGVVILGLTAIFNRRHQS